MHRESVTGDRGVVVEARLLGTRVHALTTAALLSSIEDAVLRQRRLLVGHHNLHSIALLQQDRRLAQYFEKCDLVYADGMPVVLLARLLGHPLGREHRLTSLDFVDALLRRAADGGWRVFYLGSAPGVIERGIERMRLSQPRLRVAYRHGHFDADPASREAAAVLDEVNGFDPDVLFVGMGMPRQELWIQRNLASLNARAILPIGALADYLAGAIPTPPRWAGRIGLEWLFRLLAEPRRLGHRYLVEPWLIARPLARELLERRRAG